MLGSLVRDGLGDMGSSITEVSSTDGGSITPIEAAYASGDPMQIAMANQAVGNALSSGDPVQVAQVTQQFSDFKPAPSTPAVVISTPRPASPPPSAVPIAADVVGRALALFAGGAAAGPQRAAPTKQADATTGLLLAGGGVLVAALLLGEI